MCVWTIALVGLFIAVFIEDKRIAILSIFIGMCVWECCGGCVEVCGSVVGCCGVVRVCWWPVRVCCDPRRVVWGCVSVCGVCFERHELCDIA